MKMGLSHALAGGSSLVQMADGSPPFCAVVPEVQHRSALSGRKTLTLFCFDTLLVNSPFVIPS